MGTYEELLESMDEFTSKTVACFEDYENKYQSTISWMQDYFEQVKEKLNDGKRNAKRPPLSLANDNETNRCSSATRSRRKESQIVNPSPVEDDGLQRSTKENKENQPDKQYTLPVNVKVERDSTAHKQTDATVSDDMMPPPAITKLKRTARRIKKEKESLDGQAAPSARITRSKRSNKQVLEELPVRKSTRTKKRQSDSVIFHETPVVCIDIRESADFCDAKVVGTTVTNADVQEKVEEPSSESASHQDAEETTKRTKKLTKTKKKVANVNAKKLKGKPEFVSKEARRSSGVAESDDAPAIKNAEEVTSSPNDAEESALSNGESNPDKFNMRCTVVLEKLIALPPPSSPLPVLVAPEVQSEPANLDRTVTIKPPEHPSIDDLNMTEDLSDVRPEQTEAETVANARCTVTLDRVQTPAPADRTVMLDPGTEAFKWQPVPISDLMTTADLMTDDEDDDCPIVDSRLEETKKGTPSPQTRKGIKNKAVFSPYSNSPVRKRVAAFEKLVKSVQAHGITSTVTKTGNWHKQEAASTGKKQSRAPASNRTGFMSPMNGCKLLQAPNTDTKLPQRGTDTSRSALNSTFVAKGTSRAEAVMQTHHKQLQVAAAASEKDNVKRKKDAMLQAKADEKKKAREEKELKVQKVREAMKREKEEKLRQMLAEKEAKMEEKRKYEEYMRAVRLKREEQKRLQAKKKHEERLEEEKRAAEAEAKDKFPAAAPPVRAYNAMKPPPLPTEDNADSDSSEEMEKARVPGPAWGQKEQLLRTLRTMSFIPQKEVVERFFGTQVISPDLREIFENIDERLLKRNSSAVWRTPPRYSVLPKF